MREKTITSQLFGDRYKIRFALGTHEEINAFLVRWSPRRNPESLDIHKPWRCCLKGRNFAAGFVDVPSFDKISEASAELVVRIIARVKRDNHPDYDPDRHADIKKEVFENIYYQLREWLSEDTDQANPAEDGE